MGMLSLSLLLVRAHEVKQRRRQPLAPPLLRRCFVAAAIRSALTRVIAMFFAHGRHSDCVAFRGLPPGQHVHMHVHTFSIALD